jgi:hypothetical protein
MFSCKLACVLVALTARSAAAIGGRLFAGGATAALAILAALALGAAVFAIFLALLHAGFHVLLRA